MNITPVGWAILGGSILAAVLLDYGVLWLCLEYMKPPSSTVFIAARVAKVVGLVGWVLFFSLFWYPGYGPTAEPLPQMGKNIIAGVILGVVVIAALTFPRPTAARSSARPSAPKGRR
jgi:hypothetical protein